MELGSVIQQAEGIVNALGTAIEVEGVDLKEAEERILRFVHGIGALMLQELVERVAEPVMENRVSVDGERAVYDQERNLRFRNRFGGVTVRPRRCYKFLDVPGGYYPLDEKLGLDKCGGFSPLVTFLLALLGSSRPYQESARLLSKALGWRISATAVQRNTEEAGRQLDDNPYRRINRRRRQRGCAVMVAQMDSTTTPQIHQEPQITGRQSLKQPTEWKQCHVGCIQNFRANGALIGEWAVSRYGTLEAFGWHLGRTALAMGMERAGKLVFLADGLAANWQICLDHFPGALQTLDFYHASEHLAEFCALYSDSHKGSVTYQRWRAMLLAGEVLQVMAEMRTCLNFLSARDEATRHYNYFLNNAERMHYDRYKAQGLPIGSGKVEGSCKYIVGKRFKGSGMRWKKADNESVLRVRMGKLNGYLEPHYRATPRPYAFTPAPALAS